MAFSISRINTYFHTLFKSYTSGPVATVLELNNTKHHHHNTYDCGLLALCEALFSVFKYINSFYYPSNPRRQSYRPHISDRKVKHREGKKPAQGHWAIKGQYGIPTYAAWPEVHPATIQQQCAIRSKQLLLLKTIFESH